MESNQNTSPQKYIPTDADYEKAEMEYGDFASIETMEFVSGWTSFYAAGIDLDIMTKMKGLEEYTLKTVIVLL